MTGLRWVRVTRCDNIPLREGRAVQLGGREIAIFNLGDRFLATDNQCPHRAGPLADGIVSGASVICPLHGWKIALTTGAVERPADEAARCVRAYPVRIEAGIVVVGLPEAAEGTTHLSSAAGCDTSVSGPMPFPVTSTNDSCPPFQGS